MSYLTQALQSQNASMKAMRERQEADEHRQRNRHVDEIQDLMGRQQRETRAMKIRFKKETESAIEAFENEVAAIHLPH